ncbi:MBL fold metallo-hydrolase [Paraburkholderia silviterrae]|uniref:MBL fold metallo-hydrolase n=1 Tax=Paraburkholderia silviterrae TaxID=2528715 RepID=A0A4R5M5H9_9BURK|nr:MBL fold metallo-hydrolase [Paraburkholderia silviterrae]TDG20529.1 MBL fold metallo-hydrolase [Paraburkholderia silviterrae]
MNDANQRDTAGHGLTYPCGTPPERGEAREIARGVRWMRLALPMSLAHINVWAIEDHGGHTLVDTGLGNEDTTENWRALLAGPLSAGVARVIVTHLHPDHVGMAGWLTREHGCRLWMTRTEYLQCRMLAGDSGQAAPDEAVAFYRRAGWDEAAIETYRKRFGNFGRLLTPLPASYRRMRDEEVLAIGKHEWQVVVGAGHTPEHACLYCPSLKLFISGDQVLPRISSNISVLPSEPDADPMADWLDSLDALRRRVPDDVLVLPAHNEPFTGLHTRLTRLETSQRRALERLHATLREPKRAIDTFVTLFGRAIAPEDASTYGLATGESIAHLNYLVNRGMARRYEDDSGVAWYRAN